MKAGFLVEPKHIEIKEIAIPEPKQGEVRIKLSKIGICGSDISLFLGKRILDKPTVIGHEGLGTIDKIGEDVNQFKIGQRVVVEPNIPCGHCKFCQKNRGNICENKRVIGLLENGCFAEYICMPTDFCWAISDDISDLDAVMIEPTAVVVHALSISDAKIGETIAIFGLGAIGLLLCHLAIEQGYKVVVTEINQDKLKIATNLGAIPANGAIETLKKIWEENQVVAVFECAGSANSATLVIQAAPRGSEVILLGLSSAEAHFVPLKLVREGITIKPSIIYNHPADFQKTIALIEAKIIQPSQFISKHIPLNTLQNALEQASESHQTKIIIEI